MEERGVFEIGDTVVCPHHGAGEVIDVSRREHDGQATPYLTIKIIHSDLTVMVPVENAVRAGIRSCIPEQIVEEVVGVLRDDPTKMPKNWNRRFKHNRDKIKTGDVFELAEVVRNLSIRDSLTDLFNHRHSIEIVATEFERVGRYEGGVCVLMLDVDHFKKINDEHGHQVGDVVLKDCARLMRDQLRSVDSIGRYGGEEFVVVLPHTTYEEGRATGERLRRAIEEHVFRSGKKELRVTVSVGVACYPSDAVDSPVSLIRQADQALYRAKQGGRNRVA